MSVVAIKKISKGKFEIASDSIVIAGSTQYKDPKAKLWKLNDIIVGTSGDCSTATIFRDFVREMKPIANTEFAWTFLFAEFEKYLFKMSEKLSLENTSFIVIYKGKAFELNNFFTREVTKYTAIGAGSDFALSALYLGHPVEKAVESACELSIYCERPIVKYKN